MSETKKVLIVIGGLALLLGAFSSTGNSSSGGSTTPTMSRSDCYDLGRTPSGKASDEDWYRFTHECGQYYDGPTTTRSTYRY